MKTNVNDFMDELGAGVFTEKLAHSLSEAALGTVLHGTKARKGKVTIEISFEQMGDNDQVIVSHKLAQSVPTKRGKRTEEDTTESAMFVGKGGVLSVNPPREDQRGQFNLTQVEN